MNPIRSLLASLVLASLAVLAPAGVALGAGIDPSGKYDAIKPPQPTETPGKVEVLEVFSYACPHCFTFLPTMENYEKTKPDYVEVRHMPAIFRESWVPLARAYYTAELLGVVDRVHRPIFEAIHVHKEPLDDRDTLMKFFEKYGVSNDDFNKTYDSFAVESLLRKSQVMQGRYRVMGTPSVIVNGKYRVSGNLAGSPEEMMLVVGALAERENAERVASQ